MRCAQVLLVVAIAASSGACSSSTPPRSALEGVWTASLPGRSLLSLNLTVLGTSVSGTGSLATLTSTGSIPYTVTGEFVAPEVTLSLSGSQGTMTFVGVLRSSGLAGTLNGVGYSNAPVAFSRP